MNGKPGYFPFFRSYSSRLDIPVLGVGDLDFESPSHQEQSCIISLTRRTRRVSVTVVEYIQTTDMFLPGTFHTYQADARQLVTGNSQLLFCVTRKGSNNLALVSKKEDREVGERSTTTQRQHFTGSFFPAFTRPLPCPPFPPCPHSPTSARLLLPFRVTHQSVEERRIGVITSQVTAF